MLELVIFSDSFSGGYNNSLWTIYPGQFAPIPTSFGIAVDPQHADAYSSLIHTETLPRGLIIKVDIKINTSPASDMGIFISNSQIGRWKNAYLFDLGWGGIPNTILLRDSYSWGNATGRWDTSVGIHHIEINISGGPNSNNWESNYVWQPSPLLDGSFLKLWYSGYNGSRFQIGLATSTDGVTWSKNGANPGRNRKSETLSCCFSLIVSP